MRQQPTQYYTLSREEIQAIATRSAELAIEQILEGVKPHNVAPNSFVIADTDEEDKPPLTEWERDALKSLFEPQNGLN